MTAHKYILDTAGQVAVPFWGFNSKHFVVTDHPCGLLDRELLEHRGHIESTGDVNFFEVCGAGQESCKTKRGFQICAHKHGVLILGGSLEEFPNFLGVDS
jgi:hypothetical protein